ncbi:fibrobacter succinogenes major paralogous domain-containing protein [Mucilaginibacter sp. X4EP1]|uniref:fibrobacter succinogenes major paralogous domain-containing protein n=1 Tax=Mucilaginibacter sp. X4EP1 TaxID=2723092 RepID=UPI00216A9F81|nr:fibrobacter succinogenes major paralogous domain-containing protein [Mucilaginibacter sp. X4EP1]MCS3814382.1 uncharacterized protein (TIGR02145 family) [Mucilaginibacter sp. X4EP1]
MSKSKICIVLSLVLMLFSCTQPQSKVSSQAKSETKKIDTVTYKSVVIGNQEWMSENLNTSQFRNGDTIMQAKTNQEWENAFQSKTAAWCYYNNNPENGKKYGRLYNHWAVIDGRGLAPNGWQIPNQQDFQNLIDYLGSDSAAVILKSKTGWQEGNGLNSVGFNALPAGERDGGILINNEDGKYDSCKYMGQQSCFWSSDATEFQLSYFYPDNRRFYLISPLVQGLGLSVRCFKPVKISAVKNEQPRTFKSVKIGNQIWMAENLDVSNFQNGDSISEASTLESCKQLGANQKPLFCYYNNNTSIGNQYGKLYNWYAVTDKRGLAPKGWHIPTREEFQILKNYISTADSGILAIYVHSHSKDNVASILSSKQYWNGVKNTNISGFNAVPSGELIYNFVGNEPSFGGIGDIAYFWGIDAEFSIAPEYNGDNVRVSSGDILPMSCKAVRCIKDN